MSLISCLLPQGQPHKSLCGAYAENLSQSQLALCDDYLNGEFDQQFETELKRNGQNRKGWLAYLRVRSTTPSYISLFQLKRNSDCRFRLILYWRALEANGRSLKIWLLFISELEQWLDNQPPDPEKWKVLDEVFNRAIGYLPKCPRLRLLYAQLNWTKRKLVTSTRVIYEQALKALPLTQHRLVWDEYLPFLLSTGLKRSILSAFKRYAEIACEHQEALLAYLRSINDEHGVISMLQSLCADPNLMSITGQTPQELWLELAGAVARNPDACPDGARILRSGLKRYGDSVATTWTCLASFNAVKGSFDAAVDTYEEAVDSLRSVEDFSVVYDQYVAFLHASVEASLAQSARQEAEYRMNLLKRLLRRRAEFLSAVRIRRNPQNVDEWLNRVNLFKGDAKRGDDSDSGRPKDPLKAIATFSEAVKTLDPRSAKGNYAMIWIDFAKFYEGYDDLENARKVLEKGCAVQEQSLENLVSLWCERVELELRQQRFEEALKVSRLALSKQKGANGERLTRSVRLWSLCADLEESFGTFESFKSTYDRMFDLKTITVQQVLIYADILQKRKFFDDAFQVYERGIGAFRWPHVFDIWIIYLSKYVSRYGHRRLERARDLFEAAVKDIPPVHALKLYFMYYKFEEQYGLVRNMLSILHRAAQVVPVEERLTVYKLLVATVRRPLHLMCHLSVQTAEHFGVTKTRMLFEEALGQVTDDQVLEVGAHFAELETSLMEIDRARGVYEHVSQYADPSRNPEFWSRWRAFEVLHGDESTFRELLRKRRAVQAQFEEAAGLKFQDTLLEELKQRTSSQ